MAAAKSHRTIEPKTEQPSLFHGDGLPVLVRAVASVWGLLMRGDQRLAVWRDVVFDALRSRYSNERTLLKVLDEAARLFRFLAAMGVVVWSDVTRGLVEEFCYGARPDRWGRARRPSESTAKNRHWVVRVVLEAAERLGADVDVDELLGNRIQRRAIKPPTRPLTGDETRQTRDFAYERLITSTRPLLVAISEAGGTATEIAAMRVGDVDLEAGTVTFRGRAARTNRLEGWALEAVARYFKHNPGLDADAPLCVSGRTDEFQAAHSVTVRLREVLIEAGIAGRNGVTARSIRLTGARRVLDESGIEAAARFLGANSLEAAAVALGHDWRNSDGG